MSGVFDEWIGGGPLAVVQEPIEIGGDVGVSGFTADASDDLSVLVEDEGGGDDVAEGEGVEGVEVGAGPDVE